MIEQGCCPLARELVGMALRVDPQGRLTPEAALQHRFFDETGAQRQERGHFCQFLRNLLTPTTNGEVTLMDDEAPAVRKEFRLLIGDFSYG